jgi:hypothetical protein
MWQFELQLELGTAWSGTGHGMPFAYLVTVVKLVDEIIHLRSALHLH